MPETTPFYGLTATFVENVTRYTGVEIAKLHKLVDAQLNGAIRVFDAGIVPLPDDTPGSAETPLANIASFRVSKSAGLDVSIHAGLAIAFQEQYGAVFLRTENTIVATVPDGQTSYIFLTIQVKPNSDNNDSRETAYPKIVVSSDDTLDGGVLLAEVEAGLGVITGDIIDRRSLSRLFQTWLDASLNAGAIEDLTERVEALENPTAGSDGSDGSDGSEPEDLQGQVDDLTGRVETLEDKVATLESSLSNGKTRGPRPNELMIAELGRLSIEFAQINAEGAQTLRAGIDVEGVTGNKELLNDGSFAKQFYVGGNLKRRPRDRAKE